jgi:peptide/nickel transport system permease protein
LRPDPFAMVNVFIRKVAHTIVVLLLVSFATSIMLDLTPGDPAYTILGDSATPENVKAIHKELHLDRPILTRYEDWVENVVQGDFGTSHITKEKVTDLIVQALPITLELMILALLGGLLVSIPLAIYAAYREGGRFDRWLTQACSVLVSLPAFVSVPLLVYFLVLQIKLFPATGWVKLVDDPYENLRHLVLPTTALMFAEIPVFVAALRSDMIRTLQEDFILNAQAKGLSSRRILFRHALRPSSFSLMTLAGLSMGRLLGGAVIVESLFALPGLGTLLINSIYGKDIPIVQGVVMFIAIVYVAINLVIDLLYGYLDPRVRTRGA